MPVTSYEQRLPLGVLEQILDASLAASLQELLDVKSIEEGKTALCYLEWTIEDLALVNLWALQRVRTWLQRQSHDFIEEAEQIRAACPPYSSQSPSGVLYDAITNVNKQEGAAFMAVSMRLQSKKLAAGQRVNSMRILRAENRALRAEVAALRERTANITEDAPRELSNATDGSNAKDGFEASPSNSPATSA